MLQQNIPNYERCPHLRRPRSGRGFAYGQEIGENDLESRVVARLVANWSAGLLSWGEGTEKRATDVFWEWDR